MSSLRVTVPRDVAGVIIAALEHHSSGDHANPECVYGSGPPTPKICQTCAAFVWLQAFKHKEADTR